MEVLNSLEQADPDWLTATLHHAGVLVSGKVVDVQQNGSDAFNSALAHLAVTYSPDAPANVPPQLVLKMNADGDGESEVGFYQLVAAQPRALPMLVPCYAADYDTQTGRSHLLLSDVSATHIPPLTRSEVIAGRVPSAEHLAGIIDALAAFHAYWWEHPQLGRGCAEVRWWYRDETHFERHVERRRTEWARFANTVGVWFPAHLRVLYQDALEGLPALWLSRLASRVTTRKALTLTNGDCYLNQFLCPRLGPAAAVQTYIVDFQDISANFAAYDLVYMLATFWTRAQRHGEGLEERLLHRYYDRLWTHGVHGYSWDDLLADYRLMLALMIFDPIWNQTSGSDDAYWWPKLQCLTEAYQDWNCAELMGN